jgi:hypothetical protein
MGPSLETRAIIRLLSGGERRMENFWRACSLGFWWAARRHPSRYQTVSQLDLQQTALTGSPPQNDSNTELVT